MAGADLLPFDVGEGGRRRRAVTVGELLMRQGGDTSPAPSKAAGLARLAAGVAGGIFSRIEDQKAEESRKALAAQLMTAMGTSPAAPVGPAGFTPTTGGVSIGPLRTGSAAPATGALNPTAKTIYDGLTQRGIPSIVAAGMVGNIAAESNFNPGIADNRGEGSVGLIQARGPRLAALQQMAAQRGVDFRKDTDVQLDHIVSELNGSENKAFQIAAQAKTPSEAALALAKHYERPAAWALAQSGPKRASVAEQAFRDFNMPAAPVATAQADMPDVNASPMGLAIYGSEDPRHPGFQIPPAPEAVPELRGTIAPDMPVVDAPLPPARPADLAAALMAPPVDAPLPPPRPDFASMPAADAQPASLPPQALAAALAAPQPDTSNSRDAGAGDFARGFGLAQLPGPPLMVSNPAGGSSPQRLAQALTGQGAPQTATDATAAPMTPSGSSAAPAPSGAAPDRRAALAAILTSDVASPAMQTWALSQLTTSGAKPMAVGNSIVDGNTGRVIYQAPEKAEPFTLNEGQVRFGADGRQIAAAGPKDDATPDQKNYKAAQAGGFQGSFNDFLQQRSQRQGQAVTIKDAAGVERTMFYDPVTNSLKTPEQMGAPPAVVPPPANPYAPTGKATEENAKNTGFANRMVEGHNIINDLESVGTSGQQNALSKIPYAGNYAVSPEKQRLLQAQRDFINSVLRRESGAAIAPSEFDSASKQYFPQPGDTPETIAQKRRNRETTIEGVMAGAGQGYKPPETYKRTTTPAPSTPASSVPQAAGGLPPGVRQAPDGNTYVPDPARPGKWLRVVQ